MHRSFLRPEDENQDKTGAKRSPQRAKSGAKKGAGSIEKTPLKRTSGAPTQVSQRTLLLLGLLTLTGIGMLVLWRVMG